ncbi:MAG: antirestriction protein ArdA [Planctomycetota bacterium]
MTTNTTTESTTTTTCTRPRIYVASLADYNAGRLHGHWMDADQEPADLHAQIRALLAESREPIAEEWAIHDHEGFGAWRPGEFESIDTVSAVACGIVEHGEMFAALVSHLGTVEEAARYLADGYHGAWDSVAEYAQGFVDDLYSGELRELPDFIRYRIDYEGIGDDLELGGDIFTVACGGSIHVFSSCL